jgi:hypothetical protein
MSKFHLIWSHIAQESNLGRNERILRENRISKDLPADNIRSHQTMSDLTQTISDLKFEFLETPSHTMFDPTGQCPILSNNV